MILHYNYSDVIKNTLKINEFLDLIHFLRKGYRNRIRYIFKKKRDRKRIYFFREITGIKFIVTIFVLGNIFLQYITYEVTIK